MVVWAVEVAVRPMVQRAAQEAQEVRQMEQQVNPQ
jgi:hypothetical protein